MAGPGGQTGRKLSVPSQGRPWFVRAALRAGWTIDRIHDLTGIDRWFLAQFASLVGLKIGCSLVVSLMDAVPAELWHEAKALGYSDAQFAWAFFWNRFHEAILQVRDRRKSLGIVPVYKLVDCARPSSKRRRRITTPRMRRPPKPLKVASVPPSVKPASRTGKRSSFLVVVPTALAKASSSITAAFRPRLPPVMLVSSR